MHKQPQNWSRVQYPLIKSGLMTECKKIFEVLARGFGFRVAGVELGPGGKAQMQGLGLGVERIQIELSARRVGPMKSLPSSCS